MNNRIDKRELNLVINPLTSAINCHEKFPDKAPASFPDNSVSWILEAFYHWRTLPPCWIVHWSGFLLYVREASSNRYKQKRIYRNTSEKEKKLYWVVRRDTGKPGEPGWGSAGGKCALDYATELVQGYAWDILGSLRLALCAGDTAACGFWCHTLWCHWKKVFSLLLFSNLDEVNLTPQGGITGAM